MSTNLPGPFTGDFALNLWTSFPKEEAAQVMALVQGSSDSLSEKIGKTITVRHAITHRVESVDQETGEVTTLDRIVLVSPSGESYGTVSAGVRRSLQLLMAVYGPLPWTPPLTLEVVQKDTGRGRRYFMLQPAAKGASA